MGKVYTIVGLLIISGIIALLSVGNVAKSGHYEVEVVGTRQVFVTNTMPKSSQQAYEFIDSTSQRHLRIPIDKAILRW